MLQPTNQLERQLKRLNLEIKERQAYLYDLENLIEEKTREGNNHLLDLNDEIARKIIEIDKLNLEIAELHAGVE
jgi:hypothetical protein